jgi:hypothetical protein
MATWNTNSGYILCLAGHSLLYFYLLKFLISLHTGMRPGEVFVLAVAGVAAYNAMH